MQETTKGTSKPTSAGESGSQKSSALKPWVIAGKLLPLESRQTVSVERATDTQFQAWLVAAGLDDLVDDDGIVAWSFDDRVRVINFALRAGRVVPFVEEQNNSNNSENNSESELLEGDEQAQEAV